MDVFVLENGEVVVCDSNTGEVLAIFEEDEWCYMQDKDLA